MDLRNHLRKLQTARDMLQRRLFQQGKGIRLTVGTQPQRMEIKSTFLHTLLNQMWICMRIGY